MYICVWGQGDSIHVSREKPFTVSKANRNSVSSKPMHLCRDLRTINEF